MIKIQFSGMNVPTENLFVCNGKRWVARIWNEPKEDPEFSALIDYHRTRNSHSIKDLLRKTDIPNVNGVYSKKSYAVVSLLRSKNSKYIAQLAELAKCEGECVVAIFPFVQEERKEKEWKALETGLKYAFMKYKGWDRSVRYALDDKHHEWKGSTSKKPTEAIQGTQKKNKTVWQVVFDPNMNTKTSSEPADTVMDTKASSEPADPVMDTKTSSEPAHTGEEPDDSKDDAVLVTNSRNASTELCKAFPVDQLTSILRVCAGQDEKNFINRLVDRTKGKSYLDSLKVSSYSVVGENGEADLRLCMLNGMSDMLLMKMGRDIGLPRGFPVVVNLKTQELFMSGFYPKFENDDEQKQSFLEEAKRASSLTVLRKWSGYLTSAVLYKIDNYIGFIVTSKKSADPESPYVQAGRDRWSEILTPAILEKLWEANVRSVWAETMTWCDQKHGAKVNKQSLIITGAGVGVDHDTVRPHVVGDDALFTLLQSCGLTDYCAVPIAVPPAKIEPFVSAVQEDRDFMTERNFQALLQSCQLNHHSRHMEVLGDRLEALILKFYFADGTSQILKYKFAGYTKVTMCVRSCCLSEDGTVKMLGVPTQKGEPWRPSLRFIRAIESFVSRWVFDEANRNYFRGLLLMYGEIFDRHAQAYNPDDRYAIGPWITAADELDTLVQFGAVSVQPLTSSDLKSTVKTYTMYVVLGPIGVGKSFAARILARLLNLREIDGDILHLSEETVLLLGTERNPLTLSRIACSLAAGEVPIISTGGGVFLGPGMRLTGIDAIENMIGAPINVIPLMPGPGETWGRGMSDKEFLESIYFDKAKVVAAVEGRIKRKTEAGATPMKPGEVKGLCNRLSQLSQKNLPIAMNIVAKALAGVTPGSSEDFSVTFPCAYNGKMVDTPADIVKNLSQHTSPGPVRYLHCNQHRALYLVEARTLEIPPEVAKILGKKVCDKISNNVGQRKVHHETLKWSRSPVLLDTEAENVLREEEAKQPIQLLQLTMIHVPNKEVAWACILMDDESPRHLTVNAGPHKDSMMRGVAEAYNSEAKEITMEATVAEGKPPNRKYNSFDVTYPLQGNTDTFVLIKTKVEAWFLASSVL